ncbi:MAG: DUF2017 family protein [Actinobacteria bacterium]|nr:DUF2017 family protein [Actinomycetota bacterium]
MAGSDIHVPLQSWEAPQLADLVDQFLDLLRDTETGSSPEAGGASPLDRLTPTAYPQDAEASAEFADLTRAELLDRRAADARIVRTGLHGTAEGPAAELVVPAADVDAWMRTLAALRLVIASLLGIDSEPAPDPDPADPRIGVYEWLGYRLELLVEAAEALDHEALD